MFLPPLVECIPILLQKRQFFKGFEQNILEAGKKGEMHKIDSKKLAFLRKYLKKNWFSTSFVLY
jgi:hypothetical protein